MSRGGGYFAGFRVNSGCGAKRGRVGQAREGEVGGGWGVFIVPPGTDAYESTGGAACRSAFEMPELQGDGGAAGGGGYEIGGGY